jgi:hypothetical protein
MFLLIFSCAEKVVGRIIIKRQVKAFFSVEVGKLCNFLTTF